MATEGSSGLQHRILVNGVPQLPSADGLTITVALSAHLSIFKSQRAARNSYTIIPEKVPRHKHHFVWFTGAYINYLSERRHRKSLLTNISLTKLPIAMQTPNKLALVTGPFQGKDHQEWLGL